MKMCEAFARAGVDVELIAPKRSKTPSNDPFAFAGVEPIFRIRKLPCIDLFAGTQSGFLYWLRTYSFLFFARVRLWFMRYDVLYTREVVALDLFPKAVFEVHDVTGGLTARVRKLAKHRVVAITQGLKNELVAQGIPDARILVAPDGVDVDDFAHPESKETARARLGIPEGEKVALYIGILDAWKGVDTLFAAGKLLLPDVKTYVIGGFKEEMDAVRAAHPEITFLGFRPYKELPSNQQAADVLILPNSGKHAISANYTSPLKLFTYMASGVPIVASDLPSIREVLHDTSGWFVKPDDPEALAERVRRALAEPEQSRARALRAREDVKNYTWQKRAEGILTFLGT